MTDPLTLVIGGNGKTGRRLVQRLTAQDRPVRIGSRSGGVPFDWQDPPTREPALENVDAADVSYYPDLAAPGAPAAIGAFAETALKSGTRRLVLLSGRGEEEAQASEQELAASGADWTVLRCSWFNQNFSESSFLEPVLAGEVALPADGARGDRVDRAGHGEVGIEGDVRGGRALQRGRPRRPVVPVERRGPGAGADADGVATRLEALGDAATGLAGATGDEGEVCGGHGME